MDGKSRFPLLRILHTLSLVPLLLLAVSLLFSSRGFAQDSAPGAYWMLDLNLEPARFVEAEWFEAGSLIDQDTTSRYKLDQDHSPYFHLYIIGPTGKRVLAAVKKNPYPFTSWPWSDAQHNLACDEFYSLGSQAGYWFLAILALPMIVLPYFAAHGTGKAGRYWWFIASVFVLINEVNMVGASSRDIAAARDCGAARKVVAAHTIYDPSSSEFRGLLPFHANEATLLRRLPENMKIAQGNRNNVSWEVILLLMLSFQIPAAISGAHYLFVRHPAEEHVRRRPGKPSEINVPGFADSLGQEDVNNPSPDFVLKNKARRIRNLADLFRAEREAADEAVKHERVRRTTERKNQ